MLIPIKLLEESAKRFHTWKKTKGRTAAKLASAEELSKTSMDKSLSGASLKKNILDVKENLEIRKKVLATTSKEPLEFAYERAIGKNDSVYSNFVELIEQAKRKVGRIVIKEGNNNIGYATGFMVSERLLLTNWHVFKDKASVAQSELQFNYELDTFGRPRTPVTFKLNSNDFFHSYQPLDYCLVAINPMDISNTIKLNSIGYIYLDPQLGKLGNEDEEELNVIHHPDGDYKQLSIRENKFIKILPNSIWYAADTAPGSSGSPVFNDQWQVVALHHMGVPKKKNGNYLDKNNKIIPVVNNHIDESRIHWIANEGIRIKLIVDDITKKFPNSPYINNLSQKPASSVDEKTINSKNDDIQNNNFMQQNDNSLKISVPSSLINESDFVNIYISNKTTAVAGTATGDKNKLDNTFDEVKTEDKENAVDFSKCKGYDAKFLGTEIKLPKPKRTIANQIAKLSSGGMELKYFHYSVIFNKTTKMPLISAINVEGDISKRLDNSDRDDDWLRDKRIDKSCQLTNQFYAGSNFDKGHMSRFEDANWADTEAEALRNGIYTCFYTNACPQVVALNRAGGLWGKLEKLILEKGVKKEKGKLARVSVFNGPIFSDAKDRIFNKTKIPMEFFKIILWHNDAKKIKATAFVLSQENEVGKVVKFDEAIDINTNVMFKEFQVSIKSLSKRTQIDFSGIEKYDTFKSIDGQEVLTIDSEAKVVSLIKKHK